MRSSATSRRRLCRTRRDGKRRTDGGGKTTEDEGRTADWQRRGAGGARNGRRILTPRSRSSDPEQEGDEPKESPRGFLSRIGLGLPPVLLNRMRILQEANRVKTETSPPSDRPRYASCATDRRRLFHGRRTGPSRSGVYGTHGIHGRILQEETERTEANFLSAISA